MEAGTVAEQVHAALEAERERNLELAGSIAQAEASVTVMQQHLMAIEEELERPRHELRC